MPVLVDVGATTTRRRGRSRVRLLTSTLVGAVLVAAVASSVTWTLFPPPTEQELGEVAADLVDGRRLAEVTTLYVDGSGLGPRQIRGTFAEPLLLRLEPFDEREVQRIRAAGERAGWDATIVRSLGDVSVEARRDGRLAEVTGQQLDLIPTVPLAVNLAVGVGAAAGGLTGATVNRARQRRPESATSRRWRLSVAAGVLPMFAVLALALPFFMVPANSTLDTGDYGSLALGLVVLLAGLWVPVAVVIALVVWFLSRRA